MYVCMYIYIYRVRFLKFVKITFYKFSLNRANELLGRYATCIFTMYTCMSLWYFTFLTSLKLGIASNLL